MIQNTIGGVNNNTFIIVKIITFSLVHSLIQGPLPIVGISKYLSMICFAI